MKDWLVIVLIILTILISGVAGFFFGKTKCSTEYVSVPVIREDPVMLHRIDSLNTVNKVHVYIIDSLKRENTKLKQNHEKDIAAVDTLPAPMLYRKIAEYYSRKQ
jgi:uncharacterized C2H2 Zn-finger protein